MCVWGGGGINPEIQFDIFLGCKKETANSGVSITKKQREIFPEEGKEIFSCLKEGIALLRNNHLDNCAKISVQNVPINLYKTLSLITKFKRMTYLCVRTGQEALSDSPGLYAALRGFRDSCKGIKTSTFFCV